ncbi:histone-lysine N-methyltransferase 2C isoform X5 [Paroedura picta]|uniref:histone-lysine N-methyltransferase 2C isoform X5 n=1 Tax=Paroedura picta TaxID=143630 RepID=UPI004057BF46
MSAHPRQPQPQQPSPRRAAEQPAQVPEPGVPPAAAADKRPRGRPRKDGASPCQRVRKKPRSRGKPAVEDEDSMDGLETAETENTVETEVKEQSSEEDAQTEVDGNKQLTPILQRSVSEESASSVASIGVEAKTSREHLCAFCYCGERSSLGQGELKQFSPTPGFIAPWNNQVLKKSETGEGNDSISESTPRQNSVPRKSRGQKKEKSHQSITSCTSISTQTTSDDQVVRFWDELKMVGLPDDIDVQALFEPTGHCWAHHRCAEWSLGAGQTDELLPVNVDKAVVSGSTKPCAYCKHLGATIKCCEEKCTQIYHYPCAAGAGTFQDFSRFSLLCPDHIDQAPQRSKEEANCALCDSPGDLLDQLFCTTCGQHYHGMCLDIHVTPIKRAGWQCPDCKVCQNCKHSGEDNKMLVCDTCDKGYHTFCLQPVMDSVPTNGWKCKNCRVCAECGTRTSSQWHHNCLMCDSCYRQHDNLPCPFCEKSSHPDLQKDKLRCHMCKRWIHIECDKPPDNDLDVQLKEYICSLCKHSEGEEVHSQSCDIVETAQLLPEAGTVCADEMEIENGADDVVNKDELITDSSLAQESAIGCIIDDISVDRTSGELEKQVSDQSGTDAMEPSSKKSPVLDDDCIDKPMEVAEDLPDIMQQVSDKLAEEMKPSQDSTEVLEVSMEECQLPPVTPDTIAKKPETFVLVNKERPSFRNEEPLEARIVPENAEGGSTPENYETSSLPASESCATDSSPSGEKSLKSPAETYSSFPSSVEINKTSVSSSPAASLELGSSHDMMRSQASSLESSAALPATYVSFTPKIGMGKPAITKRKFSPGRPRSRQGAWSTHNTVSPPSWSPDISEGRETFKSRPLSGSAMWSIKVGRGSGFPGKRRPRGAGLSGRGGRGRSKLKNGIGSVLTPGVMDMDTLTSKDEEENSMHNTVVLFSSSDKFTLQQDMCVVCGSFGQGAEGRLLACSQCGQCYHPYCVSIKITKVVLHKGWRCLECTVCEACGKATDPGRLLLCDDCDISYHTYCLDPPLQTVPKGGWKCKWCVWCRHCGATSPGLRCEWQNNYTQCAPCSSLSTCPVCCCNYREEELILQCRQCDRWMHAVCQNLNTEEEVESTADSGFDCSMCRPYIPPANVPSSECCEPSVAAQIITKAKELDPPKTYTQDGVCLTEVGRSQLQSLSAVVPRRKRTKPKLKLKIINQNSVAVLQTPPDIQSEHSRDGEMDDSREGDLMDCEGKSDTSPEREPAEDDPKGVEGTDGIKKRKRKPYRPGIGGFMVRQRSRTGQGKTKRSLSRKDSSGSVSEQMPNREESWSEQLPDTPVDESIPASENTEKIKKRYRKKKNKLEETFPVYLQEAFFGKDLLDTSRQSKPSLDHLSEESLNISCKVNLNTSFLDPSSDLLLSATSTPASSKLGTQGTSDDPLAALSDVLNTDEDILGILSDDLVKSGEHSGLDLCTFQVENSSSPFAGLDIGHISDDPSSLPSQCVSQTARPLSEEQLDGILSPELDKMVTDGAILGKLYKIPELEGKDVEELFTAVLSPATTQSAPLPQAPPPPPPPPQLVHLHNQGENVFSRVPLMNGLIGPAPHLSHTPLVPGGGLGTFPTIAQQSYTDTRDKNTTFNAVMNDTASSWAPSAAPLEGEGDTMSNAQRSTLKWEKEEALGEMATVAPVLYTNINFPNLKEEFPDWATRVKQIAKLWRKASSQERAPYVQKARDNRAALRINKVQMSNDSMKRQQQQDSVDPSSRIDSELFKDPLKQRESEHEQEWKFRQQMRQKSKQQAKIEATQKLEQVKNEQQQLQQQLGSQQLLNQSGSDTPSSGMQSPLTPQTGNGNMSPAQQTFHKDLFTKQLPGTPTSTPSDVFLKPQPPPPPATPNRMPVQDAHAQAPSQIFPPSSSNTRPPSPVDPYAKMVGTPRPPPVNQNQNFVRRNSVTSADIRPPPSPISRPAQVSESTGSRPSPVRDSCSLSPVSIDPYAKPPDTPRPVVATEPFSKPLGLPRSPLVAEPGKPLSTPSNDPFMKPPPRTDAFQRPRMSPVDSYVRPPLTPASVVEGNPGTFKTPMRPPQSPQDPYASMPSTPRRMSADPYERPVLTPRPVDSFSHNPSNDLYSQPPLTPHAAIKDSFAHPQRVVRKQSDSFSPSGTILRGTTQDPYAQPPGTPRPVSDPYAQPPGTPRPVSNPYVQTPGTPRPVSDPYSQPPGTPRPVSDPYAQPPGTPRPVSDPYAQPPGTPRPVSDPYAQPPGTPRPVSDPYAQPPGTPRPVSDPYAQPPGTPRPVSDPYAQPPGTPRPVSDPYAQPPGTPRPVSDPYAQPPGTPRPVSDPYAQPPGTPRPSAVDPYMHQPPTPRPAQAADLFAQVPANPRHSDPYVQPPGTPRPVSNDPYSQPPATPRPGISETYNRPAAMPNRDPYLQVSQNRTLPGTFVRPSDPCTQPPRTSGSAVTDSFSHAPTAPSCDPYDQPPVTPRPQPEAFGTVQLPHDIVDQPRSGSEGTFSASANSSVSSQGQVFPQTSQVPGPAPTTGAANTQSTMSQRQKLREIILQQQQQKKNAARQEKAPQQSVTTPHGAPVQQWQQENLSQVFNRPPPPYPGNVRSSLVPPGGLRFPGFAVDGQFNRPQFPGDLGGMGVRPHGMRFGFPGGGHGPPPCQERFLRPPQQMQRPGVPPQLRRSMSIDMPRLSNKPQMANPIGLSQHFPPQGIQVQQHNIMGQAFIELCHRAPEGRPRLPFNSSSATTISTIPQHQQRLGFLPQQDCQGPRQLEPARHNPQSLSNPLHVSTSLEHLLPSQQGPVNPNPVLVMCPLNHPTVNDAFSGGPLPASTSAETARGLRIPTQHTDGLEEKLDPDDPAVKDLDVKDLDGVEVKDLVDEDLENLNLDPEDGKGDELDTLDNLETNDRHLDDLLRSGEFDIIAYTDPELDVGDKKSVFNEELDLSVPIDDIQGKADAAQQKAPDNKDAVPTDLFTLQKKPVEVTEIKTEVLSPHTVEETKPENEKSYGNAASSSTPLTTEPGSLEGEKKATVLSHVELPDKASTNEEATVANPGAGQGPAPPPAQSITSPCSISESTPVLTSLLANESSESSDTRPLNSSPHSLPAAHPNPISSVPQTLMTPAGQTVENTLPPNVNMVPQVSHNFPQGAAVNPGFISGQPVNHNLETGHPGNPTVPVVNCPGPSGMPSSQQMMLPQTLSQQQSRERPLLLEEQPLLLQDLLDQERQEQQQQRQMQAMIRQRSEPFFPNIDFDAITDPIMKAKMVALKGINKVMAQNNMGMPPMVMNRFAFMNQSVPGTQSGEGQNLVPQAITQDGSLTPQMSRPNPPNFGPGFVNDSHRKQYEEWLQETQQLLQMQQKFLEDQIGAHRKSKKALSAKQRTAKKAGREFPEEDAEQLKHVTEQQSMVQKQLEQIRKQQKEHAELIEEYRIKQQQCGIGPHGMMPGMPSQPPIVPGGSPPAMGQQSFPMVPQQLQHQQHTAGVPGQPTQPRMPSLPGWQPSNAAPTHIPHNAPRLQPPLTQLPLNPVAPTSAPAPGASGQSGPPPRVEFDDNNPFSESFQERERKERLREQQERQRIQLMQEVDRQRALQQRMEMEQHGTMSSELNARPSLSQAPFFSPDLPCDFIQPPQPLQQSPQQQQQMGPILQQGPLNSAPAPSFLLCSEQQPVGSSAFGPDPLPVPDGSPTFHPVKQSHGSVSGTGFSQYQVRPQFAPGLPTASPVAVPGSPCSQDTSMPHGTNCAAVSQSLIQLYSDIIPEEKGKKKRTRKKKKEEDAESVNTPSTPHSDITAPPTPVVSDSVSTPTVSTPGELSRHPGEVEAEELPGSSTPNAAESQPSLELKGQISNSNLPQNKLPEQSSVKLETDKVKTDASGSIQEIRQEKTEADPCPSQAEPKMENPSGIKVEEDKASALPASFPEGQAQPTSIPAAKGESGNELLKHLLKNKKSASLLHQKSKSSLPSEESTKESKFVEKQGLAESSVQLLGNPLQDTLGCGNSQLQRADLGHEMKKQRNKRTQRAGEKTAPRSKKRKKEEEEKQAIYPNAETFMQLKQQLSLLPLMEPIIGVSFAHFLPYGSGHLNSGSRLMGSFGSATLDGVSDYYSQLIYKQNNLSNPPTPPASLPPTPPPVACQKMVNGFATTEELASKAGMLGGHDVTKVLGPKQFQLPFRSQDDLLARAMAQGPKSVDVPASLPTPPHNNHEELRVQDPCGDRDTPDSFVPSSSPESVMGMEISRYPDLSAVKEEIPEPIPSPIIPILPTSTGKGSEAKRNFIKTEPGFFGSQLGPSPNGPKSGLVSVAITLHPTAAENIGNIVAAFSSLLHVRIPNCYEVSNAPDVPSSVGMMNTPRANPAFEYRQQLLLHGPQPGTVDSLGLMGPYGLKPPNMPFPPSGHVLAGYKGHSSSMADGPVLRPQWCSHCKVVVLGSGVRRSFKDPPFLKQDSREKSERMEKDVVFCSNNCFVLYSASMQAKNSESKESIPSLAQFPMKEAPPKGFHQYNNNISTLAVHCLPQFQEKVSPPSSPLITFPPAFEAARVEPKPDELKVTVKLKPRLRTIPNGLDDCRPLNKKWKGMKWKKWNIQIVIPKGAFRPPCDEEIDEFLRKLGTTIKPDPVPKDYRKCCFCHEEGDGVTDGPARLLNLDLDLWVHLNCALWSTEVYETQAGALINVELALRRGLQMKCTFCHKMGATSGCHRLRCTNIYHFTCAIKAQCMFFKDKTMLCPMHKPKGAHEQELSYFAVFRRVYVQRDEVRQIASIVQRGDREHTFRVGSLIFHSIGQLLPHQMQAFHSSKVLYPVGYEASRLYWSTRYANRRCRYLCSIEEKDSLPLFVIRITEQGHEDVVLTDSTPKGVWDKILDPVVTVRKSSEMLQLFPAYLKGEDLFGLTVSAVARIAESLPGVEACENYTFRYGRNPLMELPLAINPTGCARSEPKMSTHVKRFVLRPHTLNSTSTSKSFQSTVTGELNAPYSKQFVHSKSSQYRKMKTEWKSNVYLARSRIQGLGLYAARDIEKHTMVIEYIGTIIRNEVANRKEKLYESQNRGVYMFRIDNDHVIDATLTGGPARYINHSCAPNCVAEVVTFERGHKIIISSSRRIQKGEELCYDYKFDFEDDQHKIPCHCGAVNCRKWMN